ncbi:peptide ABC transporter substrate-binding protein [Lactobacillus delbrueckii]|uniref:peptide ABC transporter substrate-binding protein n=1 Tax=Lactobacillus delbrueckii TaxID=1584 RepID=UPI0039C87502
MNAQQSKQLKGTTGWTVRKFASTKYLQYNIAKDKYLANANLCKAISLSKTTGSTAVRWKAMVAAERALLEDQGVTPLYYTNEATLVKTSVKGVVFNGAGSLCNFKEAYIK